MHVRRSLLDEAHGKFRLMPAYLSLALREPFRGLMATFAMCSFP